MDRGFRLNAVTIPVFIRRAEETILRPKTLYEWDDIVLGARVKRPNGTTQTMWAVASNTFRGFHRITKGCPGASRVFHDYFVSNKPKLLTQITGATDSAGLNRIENQICNEIRSSLTNIKSSTLDSYGRVRKPVDLYFQNLICMSHELDKKRADLVPHLFLALDSQMFSDPNVFTDGELETFRLSRRSTYKDVKDEKTYLQLQDMLSKKASQLSQTDMRFYRVYFDMLWNNRHQNWGSNLFETNP